MMQSVPRSTLRIGLPRLTLLAAATAFAVGLSGPALATAEADCTAMGREALEVDLTAAASDIRHVLLRSGETLHFRFETAPGPFGTLTLIEGAGSPRLLLVGPSGTAVSFTAQRGGAFGFQFARDGEAAARFTMACRPADRAPGREASARAPALGPGSLPFGIIDAGDTAAQDPPVPDLGPLGSRLDLEEHLSGKAGATQRDDATVPAAQAGLGAQMKLQWLDQRYRAAGPEGPQIDPNASGVEIGLNYKLQSAITIGALAQVNPAAEMLLGAQRSLVDQGWMAGPFTTLQLAPGLVLDARAAWGEGGAGPDEALATAVHRHLVSARLANQHVFGAWRLTPSVNFSYLQETLPGPGPAAEAPHNTAAGRIDVGPELAYRTDLTSSAFIEPRVVVGGFWGLDSLATEAAGASNHADMRLKAEAGVTFGFYNGPKLQALGALEAGDHETPDAWSGRLQLSVPLK